MNIQKVTKGDAEKRLKDHRGWMRGWLAQHADAVALEKSCRISKDFGKDFVKSMSGPGTTALVAQDKAQAHMDRHSVWITIYKRLLRGFKDGEYQDTQTVVGGICDGCKQPHRDLTKRDESYYCPECLGAEAGLRCERCRQPIEDDESGYCRECFRVLTEGTPSEVDDEEFRCSACHGAIPIGKGWRISDGKINCAECYAVR